VVSVDNFVEFLSEEVYRESLKTLKISLMQPEIADVWVVETESEDSQIGGTLVHACNSFSMHKNFTTKQLDVSEYGSAVRELLLRDFYITILPPGEDRPYWTVSTRGHTEKGLTLSSCALSLAMKERS
jgi:hypothetical protein